MKTTFLNPVLWLLAATAVVAAAGVVRGQTAKVALERTVRLACLWPVLTALVLMSAAGLASRAAIGARAERDMNGGQAAAVRRLLIQTPADAVETRSAFRDWIWPSERPTVPWETTAGSAPCPVKTMATQVPLFTIQADTPTLLVAAAPIVGAAGARALTVALLVLALAAVATLGAILLKVMELRWGSREGWLLLAVLCGWQPVLAGVRQTDIALPAAAGVLAAWYFLRSGRAAASGFAASIATCLAVPAAGVLPALARSAPRAALVGALSLAALVTGTLAVAGLHTVAGFVMTLVYAARMWSIADTNYSVLGRAVTAAIPPIVIALMLVLAGSISWWRSRTPDGAFGSFLILGLLAAPVLWSQHFTLLIVPTVVLLVRVWTQGSSASLLACTVLLTFLSLPDPAVTRLNSLLPLYVRGGGVVPAGSIALILFWLWIVVGADASRHRPADALMSAA